MNMTLEERLNEQIGDLEYKNRELENKIEEATYQSEWRWRQIRQLSKEKNLNLPLPRMEIRYRSDDYNAYADYGLVIKHHLGHIDFIPLSSTRVSKHYADKLSLPHRDGAHIIHDKENLNIPAYIVYGDKSKLIPFSKAGERSDNF